MATYEFDLTPQMNLRSIKERIAAFTLLYGDCTHISIKGPVFFNDDGRPLWSTVWRSEIVGMGGRYLYILNSDDGKAKREKIFLPKVIVDEFATPYGMPPQITFMTAH